MPALAIAIPLLAAAVLMALAYTLPRRIADAAALAVAATNLVLCVLLANRSAAAPVVYWFGGWQPREGLAVGIAFYIDPLAAGLAALVALLMSASFMFAWQFFDSVGTFFHVLMLVFLGAMTGFCFSGDIFTLFVFFELMSAAAFALTGYKIEASALEGALNFAITNSVAAFFLLWGIGLLYGRAGALNLAQLGEALSGTESDVLVTTAFVLITTAFLIKGAIFPFHLWLADAHAVAPTPVCVLFSGVMVEMGLYGAARVWWTVFSGVLADQQPVIGTTWTVAGAVTALVGAVACVSQRHLKRLLALSTVSHMGIVLMGLGCFRPRSLTGVAIYIAGHALVKGALFLCAGILLHRLGDVDIPKLRGKGGRLWITATIMVAAALGLAGPPPFGTHVGKSVLDDAAEQAGSGWTAAIGLLASALTAAAVLRAAGRIFAGWGPPDEEERETPTEQEAPETEGGSRRVPWFMLAPAGGLVVLALVLGLLPGLAERIDAHAARFQDSSAYAAAVLGSADTNPKRKRGEASDVPRLRFGLVSRPAGRSLASGFAAAALSVGIAALTLWRRRLPSVAQAAAERVLAPLVRWSELLHSGRANDYVAWLLAGLAAYALTISL